MLTVLLLLLTVAGAAAFTLSLLRRKLNGGSDGTAAGRLPRGSLGWPILGETLDFVSCAYSPRPERFVEARRRRHGAVFKTHLFGGRTVVSADAEVSRAVLQGEGRAFSPWYPKSLMELMGEKSILLLGGALQRRVHGVIGAFLKSPQLKEKVAADMRRRLVRAAAGWGDVEVVRLQAQAKSIVFQVLIKVLIGLEAGDEMRHLQQHFETFVAGLMSLPIKLPGTRLYRSLKAKKRIAEMVRRIIHQKKDHMGGAHDQHPTPLDVIDILLGCGCTELSDDLISDNMIDLMIPAEDSVPVLITLAVHYLSKCRMAFYQVEEENTELMRRKASAGEPLQWTDYMSLSFTQHVITETLRLGNIISGVMRKAREDVVIKGHLIPKGWCVFTYFRSVHLDDALYDDAQTFNPWRWKERDVNKSYFTPFGGGQRLCPGVELARLQASIFLHHLVTMFTWEAEEDQIVHFPTVRLRQGLPIKVTRRCDTS